jgi:RNA polymerase sigma-70 factor (ECF subfamily)
MAALRIDASLAARLHRQAHAERWDVSLDLFSKALETSVNRAFADRAFSPSAVQRYLEGLHLEDLALATACACGHEGAWDHFVREYRPTLYRAAESIDRSGGARDLADSLYGELFGLEEREGTRRSLFRYFHGRSSLATWLRAILAQRHVDRLRIDRRVEPLPDEESPAAIAAAIESPNPDRTRFVSLMRQALDRSLSRLEPRDRLRLACYYAQELTLAEIGRLMREHEATVSRRLARTRRDIRKDVERQLRTEAQLSDDEIQQCVESAVEDTGPMDLGQMLTSGSSKKNE